MDKLSMPRWNIPPGASLVKGSFVRIAMWSGPRNLSTAMMYAFGARDDFAVMDEPFYAPYLAVTKMDHPMAREIIEHHETDPHLVSEMCQQAGAPHLYMKHMPHHMLNGFPMSWATDCVHIHLIRHPARVIASYAAKRDAPTLEDIGFLQQEQIYEKLGGLVIDSTDIRADPEGMMRKLCDAIDLPFDPNMLNWPRGPRAEDGLWARHWYGAVHNSTGIAGLEAPPPVLGGDYQSLLEAALPSYSRLFQRRLSP